MIGGIERIASRFAALRAQNRAGFVPFIMAGDPDLESSEAILAGLAGAGADLIELGMPFSDPMADGPTIQEAGLRALNAGQTLAKTLAMVKRYRAQDTDTPIILMGYYNPIYHFGVEPFLDAAVEAGVDGLIVVDLPHEEDDELCVPAMNRGISFIRLLTPTTDDKRLPVVLQNTSGFLYYVSVAGTTGAGMGAQAAISGAIDRIGTHSDLPVAVGFGITTAQDVGVVSQIADAVVVGSAIVKQVSQAIDMDGHFHTDGVRNVLQFVNILASGIQPKNS